MASPVLLGPVIRYDRGTTAEVGKWLVVFVRNKAVSLYPTGVVISRLRGRVPLMGGSVATLDTTPHPVRIVVTDVQTKDGYFLPEVAVRLSIRLDPDAQGATAQLIDLINKDAAQLFGSIEACIRDDVSAHVRQVIARANSIEIVTQGAQAILYPNNTVAFVTAQCVELRALDGVDSHEPSWAAQVRQSGQQATAAVQSAASVTVIQNMESQHAKHAAALNHELAIEDQARQAELERKRLADLRVRAEALGIDLLAIAEPDVWGQIAGQRHQLLKTMLEQPHLARHIRTNPQLGQAILQQLGGGAGTAPTASPVMARRADLVIDAANPNAMRQLTKSSGVLSTSASTTKLQRIPLILDRCIAQAWSSCGGSPPLTGAALSVTLDRMTAFVVLLATTKLIVPVTFRAGLIAALGAVGSDLDHVKGVVVTGSTFYAAIRKVIEVVSEGARVNPIIQMRQADGRQEVLIELSGGERATRLVYEKLADPDYPGLQALENLVNKQVRIRVIPPVAP